MHKLEACEARQRIKPVLRNIDTWGLRPRLYAIVRFADFAIDWLCPKSHHTCSSLCNLCVLCASVVEDCLGKTTTETQRTQRLHREIRLFGQSPIDYRKCYASLRSFAPSRVSQRMPGDHVRLCVSRAVRCVVSGATASTPLAAASTIRSTTL